MKQRVLAILMALTMLCTALPVQAWAAADSGVQADSEMIEGAVSALEETDETAPVLAADDKKTGMDAFSIPEDVTFENPFTDVPEDEYYYTAVMAMRHLSLVNGWTPTTFEPDLPLLGEECVALSVRIYEMYYGIHSTGLEGTGTEWYRGYMRKAREYNLLPRGYDLIGNITRKQALYLLYRTLPRVELQEVRSCYRLPDLFPLDEQYDEIMTLYRAGILIGNDEYGALEGEATVTRAQYVTLLARLIGVSPRESAPIKYMEGMDAFRGNLVPRTHPFRDVTPDSFCYNDVGMLYNMGLTNGTSETTYWPDEQVLLSEAVTMAVRVYEIYHGLVASSADTRPWPDAYLELGKEYGILPKQWRDFDKPATRAQIAYLVYHTLPEEEFSAINQVTKIPDVAPGSQYYDEIIALYNAGIVMGNDEYGTFEGRSNVLRSEIASMFSRLVYPPFRKTLTLMRDLSGARAAAERIIANASGSWSVYVSDIATSSSFTINNEPMAAAGLIKLYTMGAVQNALARGTLQNSDTVQSQLKAMITQDSDSNWRSLVTTLGGGNFTAGMDLVRQWCDANGYSASGQYLAANSYTTSAANCGLFLERLLSGWNVSSAASGEMLELLKAQEIRNKIPAGVPDTVPVASKDGAQGKALNDAAIIYAPTGTYVVVILTNGGSVNDIKNVSAAIYGAMTS